MNFYATFNNTQFQKLPIPHLTFTMKLGQVNPYTANIYTVKLQLKRKTCKKCTLYKYLPYTVQCRSYSKKTVNQLYIYSTVLGAAIKCKQYSEITVESGTHVKSVKITLNIFAVYTVNTKFGEHNFSPEPKLVLTKPVTLQLFSPLLTCIMKEIGKYLYYCSTPFDNVQ
jgi:hypothetical protein